MTKSRDSFNRLLEIIYSREENKVFNIFRKDIWLRYNIELELWDSKNILGVNT